MLGRRQKSVENKKHANNAVLNHLKSLSQSFAAMQKSLELANKRIESLERQAKSVEERRMEQENEQVSFFRAKTERIGELGEQTLGTSMPSSVWNSGSNQLQQIHGRHREILAMLINSGFHTYSQIAQKLGISQSRARAYIADLKNNYNVPLKQVRDPEGYKIGVDVRFVEQILTPK